MPFLFAVVVILVVPGPDMAFIVPSGISAGRRGGVLAAVGITVGVSAHVLLAALGVGTLLRAAPALAEGIQLAGAAYLAYLAVVTWRAAGSTKMVGGAFDAGKGASSIFWRGVITNLANPKIILFFAAFLPQFVDPGRGPVLLQFLTLGLIVQAAGLAVDGMIGVAAGTVRDALVRRPRIYALLDRVAASVFAALTAVLLAEVFLL